MSNSRRPSHYPSARTLTLPPEVGVSSDRSRQGGSQHSQSGASGSNTSQDPGQLVRASSMESCLQLGPLRAHLVFLLVLLCPTGAPRWHPANVLHERIVCAVVRVDHSVVEESITHPRAAKMAGHISPQHSTRKLRGMLISSHRIAHSHWMIHGCSGGYGHCLDNPSPFRVRRSPNADFTPSNCDQSQQVG